jgi:O-antigen ligase
MAAASIGRMAGVCRNTSLVLAGCLPFLVPFDPARNIDLQGLLLVISGGFAWFALLLGRRQTLKSLGRLDSALLGIFAACCLISLVVNPHFGYDFLGAPYIRLGTAGLLACAGIGLLLTTVPRQRLLTWLYVMILGLSVVSVPYSWWHFHSLLRIGGVFAQADILACFVGCGLLFGLEMLSLYPRRRNILLGAQLFWAILLLLAQTRAVLLIVIVLCLLWELQKRRGGEFKRIAIYGAAALLLLGGLHYFMPNRLTNTAYASESIHYRLALQGYALKAGGQKPVWGYGPGNLADALSCPRLPAGALQTTCRQGYFFNSSHNIFIDRVLGIGWPGGLAFLAIVILAIYRGLRSKGIVRVLGYAAVLISCYYLTNVTSVTLELLLWVLLIQCLAGSPKKVNHD